MENELQNNVQEQPTNSFTPPQPATGGVKRSKKRFFALFLFFIIGILFIGGAYYVGFSVGKKSNNKTALSISSARKLNGDKRPSNPASPNNSLDSYKNKELISANEIVSVYMLNPQKSNGDTITEGEILIHNRNTNAVTKIDGVYSYFGDVRTYSDEQGKYVFLSDGTYIIRGGNLYSVDTKKLVASGFQHLIGLERFWRNYFIFYKIEPNLNRYSDLRGVSIAAIDSQSGQIKIIAQADDLNDYANVWSQRRDNPSFDFYDMNKKSLINSISYIQYTVTKITDWQDNTAPKATIKNYDLNNLLR